VAQLRRKKDTFEQLGAYLVLVGLGNVEETAEFKRQFKVSYAMIADPEKQLFEAFRLKRASAGSLLSPGMAVKGLKAMAKGHGLGVPKGDVRQLPGVFIIDPKGRIRFSYYAKGPADHPQPEDLLAVLRADAAA
jgi:peroxiredoxin